MELTEEQTRIVRSRTRRLAVQAGAGAAKTTTLCAYADARRGARVLYLAFNKAIQLEAAARNARREKLWAMGSSCIFPQIFYSFAVAPVYYRRAYVMSDFAGHRPALQKIGVT